MTSRFLYLLGNALRLRCPRCGRGRLFRRPFAMRRKCPDCALEFEPEQGYFVGAIYINYAATVAVAIPGFFLLDWWAAPSIEQQLAIWVPFAVVFPLLFFHHSRSFWLLLDHLLNPAKSLYSVPPQAKR